MDHFRVNSVKPKGHYKNVYLDPGEGCISVAPSACVTTGDLIEQDNGKVWVICNNGLCQIYPIFFQRKIIQFGGSDIEITVKEITEPEELKSVKALADYHYRGAQLHGRRSCLIARNFNPLYPRVLGYIELTTPFYMNKARSRILDSPFRCDGVHWEHWDKDTTRQYINIMVRIARCVICPEFRGLGIGHVLTDCASEFAKNRWQVAGFMPYFIEITADMLKYVPFVEKAGMVFIGETEGNLSRVYKDMEYLTKNEAKVKAGQLVAVSKVSGIVDKQISRMNKTLFLIDSLEVSREDLLERLKRLSQEEVLRDYALFYNIVSLPKPTYMKGLNKKAERFLQKGSSTLESTTSMKVEPIKIEPINQAIVLRNISLSFISRVRRTKLTHKIQQAFSISPDSIESQVIKDLSVTIKPGDIVLIVGPSGSGKTVLLNYVAGFFKQTNNVNISGNISIPTNYSPGVFKLPRSKKPLIELMQFKDVLSALYIMGLVGLSDAYVYLKRYEELSRGQQYRVMLAKLISAEYNVWFLDEFCANLDIITANVISDKLQKLARTLGATVIAASPHWGNYISALKPDKIIQLTSAWEYEVLSSEDVLTNSHADTLLKGSVPSLRIKKELLAAVNTGRKKSTIRAGRLKLNLGLLVLEHAGESTLVRLINVTYKRLQELTDEDANIDGYKNVMQLRNALLTFYPRLRSSSLISIVEFERILGVHCVDQISMAM